VSGPKGGNFTTNPVENMNSTIRRVARNVKRWRPTMVLRWTALGVQEAGRRFRRFKGHSEAKELAATIVRVVHRPPKGRDWPGFYFYVQRAGSLSRLASSANRSLLTGVTFAVRN
jgi:hypothetical protein